MNHEKTPYPPAYTEIYPAVAVAEVNSQNMGWQAQSADVVVMPQQPTITYGTVITQQPVANILHDQSRIGLYPMKLQPCPNCHKEGKTTIKQESTIRTHLLALILCVSCCCCCIPFAYMTDNLTKTANHFCENCKNYVGSHKRRLC